MRTLFIVLFTSLFVISSAATSAQEQEPWPVEQHCIGDLTYPIVQQGSWDFPGVIISGIVFDGVHAIRADIQTEYWLAMSSAHSFPFSGALSPDNRYFAYPVGKTYYGANASGGSSVFVENIRIVRTDGNTTETYLFAGNDNTWIGATVPGLIRVKWLGPSEAYYPYFGTDAGERLYDYAQEGDIPWTHAMRPRELEYFSPDVSRAFALNNELGKHFDRSAYSLYDLDTEQQLDYSMPRNAIWFADSSSFLSATESGLFLIGRDGQQVDLITGEVIIWMALSSNQQLFAFWNEDQQLFIGDFQSHVIYDMCFENLHTSASSIWSYLGQNLAFSPNDSQLAFSYDGYLVILDLETLENQVIDTPSDWVMGWGTLASETLEPSTPGYHWAAQQSPEEAP